jgi:hypothetical protein
MHTYHTGLPLNLVLVLISMRDLTLNYDASSGTLLGALTSSPFLPESLMH